MAGVHLKFFHAMDFESSEHNKKKVYEVHIQCWRILCRDTVYRGIVSLARTFTYPQGEGKDLVIVHTTFRSLPRELWGTIL